MTDLPPELAVFASLLDAQPEPARAAFAYCLALAMVLDGKARLVDTRPGDLMLGRADDSSGNTEVGKVKHLLVFLTALSCLVLAACSASPTPDLEATVQAAVAATQTAQPTNTFTPEPTNTPTPEPTDTPTAVPTDTPVPTSTAKPTDTPTPTAVPTSTYTVTPEPTSTPSPTPTATNTFTPTPMPATPSRTPTPTPAPELVVEFRNLHYECQYGRILHAYSLDQDVSGYRSFQADLFIENLSQSPVTPPWRPARWIVTNGVDEHEITQYWVWVSRNGYHEQPVIEPGGVAGWTFLAYPLQEGEWVKAAEFEWNGVTYRREFDLGEFGDAHNYVACH